MSDGVEHDQRHIQSEAAPRHDGRRWGTSAAVASIVLTVDQLTKFWAQRTLASRDIHLFWTLELHLTYNSGMAFSRGEGLGPYIAVVALVVIAGLLVTLPAGGTRAGAAAVGAVVGGAIGNVADRALRGGGDGFLKGSVVDFVNLQWWPVFNVADMGVVLGGLMLAILSWRTSSR